ncbi:MAG: alpha/beta fold hydrolase [Tepidisphaeraceae bacterium]
MQTRLAPVVALVVLLAACHSVVVAAPKAEDVKLMKTDDGVEFGVWGGTPDKPSPTLILLSGHIVDSFTKSNFLRAGEILVPQGYLCVSIDLPSHGAQAKKGFSGLVGWGKRAAAGEDFVAEFNERMKKVIDHLIEQKMTDPDKIVATGTSRGGFLAVRYAAFDKRVKAAVAYAPVTDLRKLKEFDVAKDVTSVDAMSLDAQIPELVGKPVLIFIGDRDDRVDTDSAIGFARKLSAAAVKAEVPSQVELHVLSEPRGHSLPPGVEVPAARWIYRVLEGKDLP